MTVTIFDTLRGDPSLVPNLRKLRLDLAELNVKYMKAMRELNKERPKIGIKLVKTSEQKKWVDWDLVVETAIYKKGRKWKTKNNRVYWSFEHASRCIAV